MNRKKIWKDGRLVFYAKEANHAFWDETWENRINKEHFRKYEAGSLDN